MLLQVRAGSLLGIGPVLVWRKEKGIGQGQHENCKWLRVAAGVHDRAGCTTDPDGFFEQRRVQKAENKIKMMAASTYPKGLPPEDPQA
jgi:hypothetical protein